MKNFYLLRPDPVPVFVGWNQTRNEGSMRIDGMRYFEGFDRDCGDWLEVWTWKVRSGEDWGLVSVLCKR